VPDLVMPKKFLQQGATTVPRTPGVGITGEAPVKPLLESVPVEQLLPGTQARPAAAPPTYQLVPVAPAAPTAEPPASAPAPAPNQGKGGL